MNRMDLLDLVDTQTLDYDSMLVSHSGILRVDEIDVETNEVTKTTTLFLGDPTVEIKAGTAHRITALANGTSFSQLRAVVDGAGVPAIVPVEG